MSIEIELTQGQKAIVCDCHVHLVKGDKWYALWSPLTKSFYAVRNISRTVAKQKSTSMHSIINGTPHGFQTDHINENTLDNRCENLRTATRSQNRQNRGKQANNSSGFKGVSWNKSLRKWDARITTNHKQRFLGFFDDPKSAARAYDDAARENHGSFAKTNFK